MSIVRLAMDYTANFGPRGFIIADLDLEGFHVLPVI
jgi:hypothetical protein